MDAGGLEHGRDGLEAVRLERHLGVDQLQGELAADAVCAVSNRYRLERRDANADAHRDAPGGIAIGNGRDGDPPVLFLDTSHVGNDGRHLLLTVFVEVADGVVQRHGDMHKRGDVRGVP